MALQRPLFLFGSGRSGTTLAYSLLSRHDDLAWFSTYEDRFPNVKGARFAKAVLRIPAIARKNWEAERSMSVRPAEPYAALDAAFPGFSEPFRDLTAEDVMPWAAKRIRAVLEAKVAEEKKPRLLLKWTGWSRVGFMDRICPDGLFVHVHRDGRAVASSLMQQPWWRGWKGPAQWRWGPLPPELDELWQRHDRSFVVLAGLQWKMLFHNHEAALTALPPGRGYRLSFEALCEDPIGHCRRIYEWAGLRFDRAVEERLRATPIEPSAVDRWRKDLTPIQARALESVLEADLAEQSKVPNGPL